MGSSRRRSRERTGGARRRLLREGSGVAALGLAAIAALALASFDPGDVPFQLGPARNAAGPLGASLAVLLRGSVGAGAFVLVPALALLGVRLLLGTRVTALRPPLLGGRRPARRGAGDAAGAARRARARALRRARPAAPSARRSPRREAALVHAAGALLLNVLLLALAALAVLGVAPGSALAAAGAGAAATGRVIARGVSAAASGAATAGRVVLRER